MATIQDFCNDFVFSPRYEDENRYFRIINFEGVVEGNRGPKLENSHYKAVYPIVYQTGPLITDITQELSFTKTDPNANDFYPIIVIPIYNGEEGSAYEDKVGTPVEQFGYNSGTLYRELRSDMPSGYDATWKFSDTASAYSLIAPQYVQECGTGSTTVIDPAHGPRGLCMAPNFSTNIGWDRLTPFASSGNYGAQPSGTITTNIPVVVIWGSYMLLGTTYKNKVINAIQSYVQTGNLRLFNDLITEGNAFNINFNKSVDDDTKGYQLYCDVTSGVWDVDGVSDEEIIGYRYLQAWVTPNLTHANPRISLYKRRVGNELRAYYKVYGDLQKVRYSTDGGNTWNESTTIPFEYFYYKRTDEKGLLTYDSLHGGNILLFATEQLCDDGSPFLAENYAEKSQYYPSSNTSGTDESSSLMATTNLNSFFQRMYLVDSADMAIISSALYDTTPGGIWEDIKKGIDMFGENPIDCVAGLLYMPFDCTTVFTGASAATSIFFGGYQLTGVNVYELMNYNGYLDIGTVEIKESFPHGSYRNYEPFTSLKIWLPFVGLKELHLNKYVGKQLSVRYYFDCFNGGCLAVLFADGLMTDIFDGMAGVQIPISLTDFASYAATQIQNFTELGSSAASAFVPLAGGATPSSLIGAAAGTINFEKSLFNASQTTTSNFNTTKGASSAMINQYLPNYVFLIFEIIEEDETSLLSELMGKPSNASGTLGSFSGYLEVDDIELKTSSGMTEKEKNQFISLCHSGIII